MHNTAWWLSAVLVALPVTAAEQKIMSPDAAVENALRNMVGRSTVRGFTAPNFVLSPDEQTPRRVCSVPLRELPIPSGTRYTLKELHIAKDAVSRDVVPVTQLPAPPCPTVSR